MKHSRNLCMVITKQHITKTLGISHFSANFSCYKWKKILKEKTIFFKSIHINSRILSKNMKQKKVCSFFKTYYKCGEITKLLFYLRRTYLSLAKFTKAEEISSVWVIWI